MLNTPEEVIGITRRLAIKKYKTPLRRFVLLGILAGAYIAMGGLLSTLCAAGLGGLGADNPMLPRLVAGMTFPVGLMLVVLVGGELFTSNAAYLLPAAIRGDIPRAYVGYSWAIIYLANLLGALLFDYLLVYLPGILEAEPYRSYIMHAAEHKVDLPWLTVLLRGVGANWMVCLAVWLALSARSMLGRLIGIWWPVMAFVAIGYEHSIANMYYIPTGYLYGGSLTLVDFLWGNLLPATLGNLIGGALFVGAAYAYLYSGRTAE